jgi:hypothetical protein
MKVTLATPPWPRPAVVPDGPARRAHPDGAGAEEQGGRDEARLSPEPRIVDEVVAVTPVSFSDQADSGAPERTRPRGSPWAGRGGPIAKP